MEQHSKLCSFSTVYRGYQVNKNISGRRNGLVTSVSSNSIQM